MTPTTAIFILAPGDPADSGAGSSSCADLDRSKQRCLGLRDLRYAVLVVWLESFAGIIANQKSRPMGSLLSDSLACSVMGSVIMCRRGH